MDFHIFNSLSHKVFPVHHLCIISLFTSQIQDFHGIAGPGPIKSGWIFAVLTGYGSINLHRKIYRFAVYRENTSFRLPGRNWYWVWVHPRALPVLEAIMQPCWAWIFCISDTAKDPSRRSFLSVRTTVLSEVYPVFVGLHCDTLRQEPGSLACWKECRNVWFWQNPVAVRAQQIV